MALYKLNFTRFAEMEFFVRVPDNVKNHETYHGREKTPHRCQAAGIIQRDGRACGQQCVRGLGDVT